jgi:hypothetical protein
MLDVSWRSSRSGPQEMLDFRFLGVIERGCLEASEVWEAGESVEAEGVVTPTCVWDYWGARWRD